MHLLLLSHLLAACGPADPDVPEPIVTASADDEGVLVALPDGVDLAVLREHAADQGAASTGIRLQWQDDDGAWYEVMGPAGQAMQAGAVYHVPAETMRGAIDRSYRLAVGALRGPAVGAVPGPDATLRLDVPAPVLVGEDVLRPTLTVDASPLALGAGRVSLQATLTTADGVEQGWLSDACSPETALADCWTELPTDFTVDSVLQPDGLPGFRPQHAAPGTLALAAFVSVDAVGLDGLVGPAPLASARTAATPSTGRLQYFGDLHAHTNLSHDGCELPDASCDHRGTEAGGDFFANATANLLDFVAITDHAEWSRYYPDGMGGDFVDIWESQNRLAEAADDADLVALVGYEWTNKRDKPTPVETDYEGGHKTVVLRELWVEDAFRIGATDGTTVTTKGGLSAYELGDNPQTTDPREFYDLLDAAAATYGSTPVLSFFHHPALEKPQGVDWGNPINVPDSRYERLIEVYSEHGSSECIDPDQPECNWLVNDETFAYLTRGTVQYALSMGYRLGFVAGTDCHDARPGSIADGPSTHGNPGAPADAPLNEQFAPGGITGVLVPGALDRDSLFDALMDRATFATSGPRPVLRVIATADDGRAWLPGEVVPDDVAALQLHATIQATGNTTVRGISLVEGDGTLVQNVTGDTLQATLDPAALSAIYLRVIVDDGDGEEQRVWVSPFFMEGA